MVGKIVSLALQKGEGTKFWPKWCYVKYEQSLIQLKMTLCFDEVCNIFQGTYCRGVEWMLGFIWRVNVFSDSNSAVPEYKCRSINCLRFILRHPIPINCWSTRFKLQQFMILHSEHKSTPAAEAAVVGKIQVACWKKLWGLRQQLRVEWYLIEDRFKELFRCATQRILN